MDPRIPCFFHHGQTGVLTHRRDIQTISELEIELYIADMMRLRKKKRKFYLQYE